MKSLKERLKIYRVAKGASVIRAKYMICPRCWQNYPIDRKECPHCGNYK